MRDLDAQSFQHLDIGGRGRRPAHERARGRIEAHALGGGVGGDQAHHRGRPVEVGHPLPPDQADHLGGAQGAQADVPAGGRRSHSR